MCTYLSLINNKYFFPRISHFYSSLERVSIVSITKNLLNNMPTSEKTISSEMSINNRKRKSSSLSEQSQKRPASDINNSPVKPPPTPKTEIDSLRVKRLTPKAKIPVRSSGQAAGYDLSRYKKLLRIFSC